MSIQIAATVGQLVVLGIAVSRRLAFEGVQNVHVLATQRAGFDDLVQKLTGAADKRFALLVLVSARRLAEEAEPCIRIADAKHGLLSGGRQFTTTHTTRHFSSNDLQSRRPL